MTEASPAKVVTRFAHDAASPLMIVLALSEQLAGEPTLAQSVRADLHDIRTAGEQLLALIQGLHTSASGWSEG